MPSISNPTLPAGYRHIGLGDAGSTNTECLDMARRGEPGGLWITADRQLAGKGSRGRGWVSEAGNLYASLLLTDPGPAGRLHTLAFVVSLAIRDAIGRMHGADESAITLKWPNDVLVNGRKVSGVLLESHQLGGTSHVIAGMGINVAHAPESALFAATALALNGIDAPLPLLFEALASAIDARLRQWDRGAGFASIRKDWLDDAQGLGQPVRVQLPAGAAPQAVEGVFAGIDEDGLIEVRGNDGSTQRVSVADIFFA